jgi:hypothetical protein
MQSPRASNRIYLVYRKITRQTSGRAAGDGPRDEGAKGFLSPRRGRQGEYHGLAVIPFRMKGM